VMRVFFVAWLVMAVVGMAHSRRGNRMRKPPR
jgi:hypothetical protein